MFARVPPLKVSLLIFINKFLTLILFSTGCAMLCSGCGHSIIKLYFCVYIAELLVVKRPQIFPGKPVFNVPNSAVRNSVY